MLQAITTKGILLQKPNTRTAIVQTSQSACKENWQMLQKHEIIHTTGNFPRQDGTMHKFDIHNINFWFCTSRNFNVPFGIPTKLCSLPDMQQFSTNNLECFNSFNYNCTIISSRSINFDQMTRANLTHHKEVNAAQLFHHPDGGGSTHLRNIHLL
jgi:hypothetical protein